MTQLEQFIAAIKAAPEDDTPRLALADWLEDSGDLGGIQRADFIRITCELAKLGPVPNSLCCLTSQNTKHRCAYQDWHEKHPKARILMLKAGDICPPLKMIFEEYPEPNHQINFNNLDPIYPITPHLSELIFTYERGFISKITGSLAGILDHGPKIAKMNVVTEVEYTGSPNTIHTYDIEGNGFINFEHRIKVHFHEMCTVEYFTSLDWVLVRKIVNAKTLEYINNTQRLRPGDIVTTATGNKAIFLQ